MVKLWVSECETAADLLASFRIRHEVFSGEQSVTFAEEFVAASRLRWAPVHCGFMRCYSVM
ncbi:hypothetical protein HHJ81_00665 [Mobiluncus mulieris]|uniref:hypothetical protein n=1 Tax=Mobiluncus mulieris TaxID=2052 RepID=UPI00019F94AF|nr:hypothetical protein [Mobiluncus mulieris]EEJ54575.1 hypothetical protein HMPREF0577_0416 [Mobiluncus mulieris ATCC 35243]NMW59629.1 hypothetical protein [Mobiluncus mulieris]SPX76548.1 Uncharacterised protein [Mobiluncus mulieris]